MENLEVLVQEITDRLLANLRHDSLLHRSVYFIGQHQLSSQLIADGYTIIDEAKEADEVIAANLPLDSLLRVACLCPLNESESELLACLLSGKTVSIVLESQQLEDYRQTATARLYKELMQQKVKLEQYGAQFYPEEELLSLLRQRIKGQKENQKTVKTIGQKTIVKKRSLITEAKLRALHLAEGDCFTIEQGMIVTALARDYLKRHRITIVE